MFINLLKIMRDREEKEKEKISFLVKNHNKIK